MPGLCEAGSSAEGSGLAMTYLAEAARYHLPYPRTRTVLAASKPRATLRQDAGSLWAYDRRCLALERATYSYLARLLGLTVPAARSFDRDDLIDAVLAIEFGID
jgi:hypothetical protein